MDTLLSSVERTARKDHVCNASEILRNCYGSAESIIYEGSFCTFKAVTPLHEICIKFNMYDD
jgi:hypothetical protein